MNINESYKEIQCIKMMSEEYMLSFNKIVEFYAPQLPEKIVLEGSAYTLHDFNHHCINIYKCISEIILNDEIVYAQNGLGAKELYILNLAVLFHDIGMTTYVDGKRDNHSYLSAKKIEELYNNEESVYAQNIKLRRKENEALMAIIMAHSDVKDGSIDENEKGLNNSNLTNSMQATSGKIRGKLLASILRLADEMDVTVDRIGSTSIERNLHDIEIKLTSIRQQKPLEDEKVNASTEAEIRRLEKFLESLEHWKRLYLFSEWRREKGNDEVCLIINDDYINQCRIEGETYECLAEEIVNSYKKIKEELEKGLKQNINSETQNLALKALIAIDRISLFTKIDELKYEIQSKMIDMFTESLSVAVRSKTDAETEKESLELGVGGHYLPALVDDTFAIKFAEMVRKKHLIKVGHFVLNNTYCARDWIDTKEIVETQDIMDEMVFKIVKNIYSDLMSEKKEDFEKDCLIVGLDLEGAVIAARVAMALQMAFSYIIPTKELKYNADKEKEIQFGDYRKIVLITDSIVTYETINTSLKYIGITEKEYDRIDRIYTMFFRDSAYETVEAGRLLLKKTYCICNEFDIELFEKCKCSYREHECFGEKMQ